MMNKKITLMSIQEKTLNNFLVRYGFNLINIDKRYKHWGLKYYIGGEAKNIFLEQYQLNNNLNFKWYCNNETMNINKETKINTLGKDFEVFIEMIRKRGFKQ